MAIVPLGEVGSNNNKTSGTTLAVTNTSASVIPAGTLLLMIVGYDNHASLTAATVTPSNTGGSAWTAHLAPVGSGITTSVGAGIWHTTFSCRTVSDVAVGGTLTTLTFSNAVVGKVAMVVGFSGLLATLRGTTSSATSISGVPTVTTTGTAPVAGDLVIGCATFENNAAPTADSDTLNGSWSSQVTEITTGGGAAATNVAISVQWKIVTAGGNQTYNPSSANDAVVSLRTLLPEPEIAVTQAAYRVYADGTESGSTALAAQDTGYTADLAGGDVALGLRTRLQSTSPTAQPATDDWQLQFEKNASGVWADVGLVAGLTDSYPASNASGQQGMIAGNTQAQSFLGDGRRLARAGFYLSRSNSPDGNLTALLYACTGSVGSGTPTGSPLATSTTSVPASSLTTTETWYYFDFDSTFTMLTDTVYAIALATSQTTGAPHTVDINVDNTSPTHVGRRSGWNGSTWIGGTEDLIFEVYSTVVDTLVDSYPEVNRDAVVSMTTAGAAIGQSFLGKGSRLTRAGFYLRTTGTPPAGNITAALYAHAGTFGTSSVGTGTALATSTTSISAPSVSNIFTWYEFIFDGTFTLVDGVPYVIAVVSDTANDGSNFVAAGSDASTPSHAGNLAVRSGVWTPNAPDLIFRVYGPGGLMVTGNPSATPTDGAATTNRLTAGTGTFVAGEVSNDGLADNLGWSGNNYTELLYSILLKQADLVNGDVLRFRVLRNGATTWLTYTQTPTLTVSAGAAPQVKTPADAAAGSDSATADADRARTPADTAAGADSVTVVWDRARTLDDTAAGADTGVAGTSHDYVIADTAAGFDVTFAATEAFDTGLPADIYTVGGVTHDPAAPGTLHTDGSGKGWYGVPYSRWHMNGAFAYRSWMKINDAGDIARDIYNLTFWANPRTPGGTNVDGFFYRLQTAANDGGLGILTNGSPTMFGGSHLTPALPENTWLLVILQVNASGTSAQIAVYDRDTLNNYWFDSIDLTPYLDAQHLTSGVIGQQPDGAGSPTGTRIDGIRLVGTQMSAALSATPADTAAGADSTSAVSDRVRTVSDPAGGLDSLSAVLVSTRTLSDPAAGADALTALNDKPISVTDTAQGLDSLAALSTQVRTVGDLAGGTDSATASTVLGVNRTEAPADLAAGADAVTTVATADRTVPDTAGGTDAASAVLAAVRSPSDTAAGADLLTALNTAVRTLADVAGGVDTVLAERFGVAGETFADSADGTDALSIISSRTLPVNDPAGGSDSLAAVLAAVRSPSDTAAGSDSASALLGRVRTVDDSAAGADSLTTTGDRVVTLADVAAGADQASASTSSATGRTLADLAGGSDQVVVTRTQDRSLADVAGGTDLVAWERELTWIDSAVGADLLSQTWGRSRVADDAADGLDALNVQQANASGQIIGGEAQGLDDLVTAWNRARTVADSASGSDLLVKSSGGNLADSASAADVAVALAARVRVVSDGAVGADDMTVEKGGTSGRTLDEVANGSDTVTVSAFRERPLDDTAGGVDVVVHEWRRALDLADNATGHDVLARSRNTLVNVSDSAQGTDDVTALLLGDDVGTPVYGVTVEVQPGTEVDIEVRPYAGSVRVRSGETILVKGNNDTPVLVKVGTDG